MSFSSLFLFPQVFFLRLYVLSLCQLTHQLFPETFSSPTFDDIAQKAAVASRLAAGKKLR
jgi:hypothetical protein